MAFHTQQDLATSVFRRLSSIDQNAQPSATEASLLFSLYNDKFAELSALDLVYWTNTGTVVAEIPGAVFQALVRIMCEEIAPNIGEPIPQEQDEDGNVLSIGNKGLRMLRRQMARPQSDLPVQLYYF